MMKMHNTDTIDYAAQIKQNAAYLRDRHAMHPMADTLDRHADAFAAKLAEAEARAGRWKRKSLAQDAYEDALLCVADGDEQERVREELRAAHNALKAHGDLDAGKGEV
jgi:hypothetical protein